MTTVVFPCYFSMRKTKIMLYLLRDQFLPLFAIELVIPSYKIAKQWNWLSQHWSHTTIEQIILMTIDFIGRIDFKIPNAKNYRQSEKTKNCVVIWNAYKISSFKKLHKRIRSYQELNCNQKFKLVTTPSDWAVFNWIATRVEYT